MLLITRVIKKKFACIAGEIVGRSKVMAEKLRILAKNEFLKLNRV